MARDRIAPAQASTAPLRGAQAHLPRVAHLRPNYAERRLIIDRVPGAHYLEVPDSARRDGHVVARINAIARRELISPTTIDNLFRSGAIPGVSLLHLVNAISLGPTPWVSSFETVIPRFAGNLVHPAREPDFAPVARHVLNHVALRAMSQPPCLALLSLSAAARTIEDAFLDQFGRRGEQVRAKISVLHPPQAPSVVEPSRPMLKPGDTVRIAFVGASFVRKGGRELLHALIHLRESAGLTNVHLTVVSAMQIDAYATGETERELRELEGLMVANASWITWHRQLPNEQVIALMRATDLGMLPTHADTYGYSVLEFQSCGVPVVTTDVRALPEINPPSCGWLLRVTKNRFGEIRRDTDGDRAGRATEIREGLVALLGDLLRHPESLAVKGKAALERIRAEHDPRAYGDRLRAIYDTRLALPKGRGC